MPKLPRPPKNLFKKQYSKQISHSELLEKSEPIAGNYSHLHTFVVGDDGYEHVINPDNDSTYILDVTGNRLFEVSNSSHVYDLRKDQPQLIGKFRMNEDNCWIFNPFHTQLTAWKQTSSTDLLRCEVEFFKFLLEYEAGEWKRA